MEVCPACGRERIRRSATARASGAAKINPRAFGRRNDIDLCASVMLRQLLDRGAKCQGIAEQRGNVADRMPGFGKSGTARIYSVKSMAMAASNPRPCGAEATSVVLRETTRGAPLKLSTGEVPFYQVATHPNQAQMAQTLGRRAAKIGPGSQQRTIPLAKKSGSRAAPFRFSSRLLRPSSWGLAGCRPVCRALRFRFVEPARASGPAIRRFP